ncbi:MAG: VWA domain-containing protein [Planctomycetota bacterium]|nr:VWA domain-containing protein [Planctomycetota bacterium]
MELLNPTGLIALAGVPLLYLLAIVLHRPRVLVVPSLMIWKRLPRPDTATPVKARRRVTLSLFLLVGSIILASLALARPALMLEEAPPPSLVVALDTSASMLARNTPGGRTRWREAIVDLRRLLDELPPDSPVFVVSEDPLPLPAGLTVGEIVGFLQFISEPNYAESQGLASAAEHPVNADALVNRATAVAAKVGASHVVVFSDGAGDGSPRPVPSPARDDPGGAETRPRVVHLLYGAKTDNVAIVHMAATTAHGRDDEERATDRLRVDCLVRVRNFSEKPCGATLTLSSHDADGRVGAGNSVELDLAPNSAVDHVFTAHEFSHPKERLLAVRLESHPPFQDCLDCDDTASLQLETQPALQVCLVTAGNSALERAFLATGECRLDVRTAAPADDDVYDLLVFDGVLPESIPSTAVVLVAPPGDCPPFRFNSREELAGDIVVADDGLVRGARLDTVNFARAGRPVLASEAPGRLTVLVSRGGVPLISRYSDDLTGVWLLVIPFDVRWRGEQSDADWSVLPPFPLFWANVVTELQERNRMRPARVRRPAEKDGPGRPGEPPRTRGTWRVVGLLDEDESDTAGSSRTLSPAVAAEIRAGSTLEPMRHEFAPALLVLALAGLLAAWLHDGRKR